MKDWMKENLGLTECQARYDVTLTMQNEGHIIVNHNENLFEIKVMSTRELTRQHPKIDALHVLYPRSMVKTFRFYEDMNKGIIKVLRYTKSHSDYAHRLSLAVNNFVYNWSKEVLADEWRSGTFDVADDVVTK